MHNLKIGRTGKVPPDLTLKESHAFVISWAKCIYTYRGLDVVLQKRWRKWSRGESLSDPSEFQREMGFSHSQDVYFQGGKNPRGEALKH